MTYDKYYLLFYVTATLLVNIVAKLRGERELPFAIALFGAFMSFTSWKTAIQGILILLFFPFVNIFIAFVNLRPQKHFLITSSEHTLDGYEIQFKKETLDYFSKLLIKNKIRYKEKFLNDNLKVALIFALRGLARHAFTTKVKELNLNSMEMKILLDKELEVKIVDKELLELLKNEVLEYIKTGKENLITFEIEVKDDKILLIKNSYEPKAYKRETLNL